MKLVDVLDQLKTDGFAPRFAAGMSEADRSNVRRMLEGVDGLPESSARWAGDMRVEYVRACFLAHEAKTLADLARLYAVMSGHGFTNGETAHAINYGVFRRPTVRRLWTQFGEAFPPGIERTRRKAARAIEVISATGLSKNFKELQEL